MTHLLELFNFCRWGLWGLFTDWGRFPDAQELEKNVSKSLDLYKLAREEEGVDFLCWNRSCYSRLHIICLLADDLYGAEHDSDNRA